MKQFSVGTWHIDDPTLAFGRAYPFGAPKRLEFQLPCAWSNSMSSSKTGSSSPETPKAPSRSTSRSGRCNNPSSSSRSMSGRSRSVASSKHRQEFLRRDIGEGRAGFGRAQGPVDEIEAVHVNFGFNVRPTALANSAG